MDDEAMMAVRLPKDLKDKFFEETKTSDITPSQVVRQLIKRWLSERTDQAGQ